MELTKPHLSILAAAYYDSIYSDGMYRTYQGNCSCEACKAANQLMQYRLTTLRRRYVGDAFSVDITETGREVFTAQPLVEVVHALDELDWFVLAGNFIMFLSLADLCEFIAHDYDYYRDRALARYRELAQERLRDGI